MNLSMTVTIDGKEYPAKLTMGAMIMFEDMRRKSMDQLTPGSVTDLSTLFYAMAVSEAENRGKEFPYTYREFCNKLEPSDITQWTEALANAQQEMLDKVTEKKSRSRSLKSKQ